ncbi:MAG: hypothetical protein SOV94_02185 [Eubacteriales bacterium]|nr:hypothetical protein [Eubacteriales bacterium]MDY2972332.1 hypothetical protein [Eubacteriales bacterium]
MSFIPIEYNNICYSKDIKCNIKEIAGNFDKENIEYYSNYSLHTEYSYGQRKFNTNIVNKYKSICEAHKEYVPQLWKSVSWAKEFADFIFELTNNNEPSIIEIHPPFNDYCNLSQFIERYFEFEQKIHSLYSNVDIVIENRSGSIYKGGKFLISNAKQVLELGQIINSQKINLGIVLDFPQLLMAEHIDTEFFNKEKFSNCVASLDDIKNVIKGIHIWAKKKNEKGRWIAHNGNFDTYFCNKKENIDYFVSCINSFCNDGVSRYFVPEVNSGKDDLDKISKYFLSNKENR